MNTSTDLNKAASDARADRLAAWIDNNYPSQRAFVEKFELNQGEISAIVGKRRVLGERKARKLESQTNMPSMYLDGGGNATIISKGVKSWKDGDPIPQGMVKVPYYENIYASCGNGYSNDELDPLKDLYFREETLREYGVSAEHAKAIRVIGDSMYPEIRDGETVSVDTSATRIFDGEIYAINHDGMIKVKYAHRIKEGGFKLVSRNEDKVAYPDEIFTPERIETENVTVIGQFWWQSKIRKIRR